jgi:hypothetical protein
MCVFTFLRLKGNVLVNIMIQFIISTECTLLFLYYRVPSVTMVFLKPQ